MVRHLPKLRHIPLLILGMMLSGCQSEYYNGQLIILSMPVVWSISCGVLVVSQKMSQGSWFHGNEVIKDMYLVIMSALCVGSVAIFYDMVLYNYDFALVSTGFGTVFVLGWFFLFWMLLLIIRRVAKNDRLMLVMPEILIAVLNVMYAMFGVALYSSVFPDSTMYARKVLLFLFVEGPILAFVPLFVTHLTLTLICFRKRLKNKKTNDMYTLI